MIKGTALGQSYALIRRLLDGRRGLLVVGLCGAQGSGKSTLTAAIAARLARENIRSAVLSLDDLYFTRRQRARLAAEVHPLFATRGVPGTHDIRLGLRTIQALAAGEEVALPRFDKSIDDRTPVDHWPISQPETQILILEGWCVGARPQADDDLAEPVNALEREEDPKARWRRYANEALAGAYQRLFAQLDCLIMLQAPSFDVVREWRTEQERNLRRLSAPSAPGLLSDDEVARFVQHYERLTRHILHDMPPRADLTLRLASDRRLVAAEPSSKHKSGIAFAYPVPMW